VKGRRATLSGFASAGVGAVDSALWTWVTPELLRILAGAIVVSLMGGVAAAIMPWGETSWGARHALRAILLGVILGTISAFGLMDAPAWIGDGTKLVLQFLFAFTAAETLRKLRALGPQAFIAWVLRRHPAKESE
jgi:hypothetical protein